MTSLSEATAMTLSKKRKMIVISASVGLFFFFLAPVVPVQGQTTIPVPADSIVGPHCGWTTYNYTWLEFKSFGSHLLRLVYKFCKDDLLMNCQLEQANTLSQFLQIP